MSIHTAPQSNCRPVRQPASESDVELFRHVEQNLYTAVVADALDELGFREQAMYPAMRPLNPDCRLTGWARTIRCEDVYDISEDPYAVEIEALDSFLPGEVAVVATGNSVRNAPWGELLSTAAKARGARGAVIAGLVRDVQKITSLVFPVFATGIKPVDSKGRGIVRDYNCPVECGDVHVKPGDLVFADYDGVVVIPAQVVTDTVRLATEKVGRENHSRTELMRGALLSDVYRKYGVL
ncbi:MAG TPA: RraA family protein [Bryobacteraceae bacterium]|nr:RraA family protein [Bryobacteraceae bacterium]